MAIEMSWVFPWKMGGFFHSFCMFTQRVYGTPWNQGPISCLSARLHRWRPSGHSLCLQWTRSGNCPSNQENKKPSMFQMLVPFFENDPNVVFQSLKSFGSQDCFPKRSQNSLQKNPNSPKCSNCFPIFQFFPKFPKKNRFSNRSFPGAIPRSSQA